MLRVWIVVIAVVGSLLFAGWASDFITMQGERTIYTVDCAGGSWQGAGCTGSVVTGPRYRYRALKPHREVIFWTVGSTEPSGKFNECSIQDGRNWLCKVCPDAARSITLQMAKGVPVPGPDSVTRPFRAVSKWRWLLLQRGLTAGTGVPAAKVPAAVS
ncbi:MAG: hypothetical protein ABIO71_07290 [Caldimonas sp.]